MKFSASSICNSPMKSKFLNLMEEETIDDSEEMQENFEVLTNESNHSVNNNNLELLDMNLSSTSMKSGPQIVDDYLNESTIVKNQTKQVSLIQNSPQLKRKLTISNLDFDEETEEKFEQINKKAKVNEADKILFDKIPEKSNQNFYQFFNQNHSAHDDLQTSLLSFIQNSQEIEPLIKENIPLDQYLTLFGKFEKKYQTLDIFLADYLINQIQTLQTTHASQPLTSSNDYTLTSLLSLSDKKTLEAILKSINHLQTQFKFSRKYFLSRVMTVLEAVPVYVVWLFHKLKFIPFLEFLENVSNFSMKEIVEELSHLNSKEIQEIFDDLISCILQFITRSFNVEINVSFQKQFENCKRLIDYIRKLPSLDSYKRLIQLSGQELSSQQTTTFLEREMYSLLTREYGGTDLDTFISTLDITNESKISDQSLEQIFFQILDLTSCGNLVDSLSKAIKTKEVDWNRAYIFINCLKKYPKKEGLSFLYTLIQDFVNEAITILEPYDMKVSFLLARMLLPMDLMNPLSKELPSYPSWLKATFIDDSKIHSSKKNFQFVLQVLGKLVPIENPTILKIHYDIFNQADKTKSFVNDYVLSLQGKLTRLGISLNEESEASILKIIENAISNFKRTNKIPDSILKRAVVQKKSFVQQIIPNLLLPEAKPDPTKLKLIEGMVKEKLIPVDSFQQFKKACQQMAENKNLEFLLPTDSNYLTESLLKQIQYLLDGFKQTIIKAESKSFLVYFSKLGSLLSSVHTSEHDLLLQQNISELLLQNFGECVTIEWNRIKTKQPLRWTSTYIEKIQQSPSISKSLLERIANLVKIHGIHLIGIQCDILALLCVLITSPSNSNSEEKNFVNSLFESLSINNDVWMTWILRFACSYINFLVLEHSALSLSFSNIDEEAMISSSKDQNGSKEKTHTGVLQGLPTIFWILARIQFALLNNVSIAKQTLNSVAHLLETFSKIPLLNQSTSTVHLQLKLSQFIKRELSIDPSNDILPQELRLYFIKKMFYERFLPQECEGNLQRASVVVIETLLSIELSHPNSGAVFLTLLGDLCGGSTTFLDPPSWLFDILDFQTKGISFSQKQKITQKFFYIIQEIPPSILFGTSESSSQIINKLKQSFTEHLNARHFWTSTNTSYITRGLLNLFQSEHEFSFISNFIENEGNLFYACIRHWTWISPSLTKENIPKIFQTIFSFYSIGVQFKIDSLADKEEEKTSELTVLLPLTGGPLFSAFWLIESSVLYCTNSSEQGNSSFQTHPKVLNCIEKFLSSWRGEKKATIFVKFISYLIQATLGTWVYCKIQKKIPFKQHEYLTEHSWISLPANIQPLRPSNDDANLRNLSMKKEDDQDKENKFEQPFSISQKFYEEEKENEPINDFFQVKEQRTLKNILDLLEKIGIFLIKAYPHVFIQVAFTPPLDKTANPKSSSIWSLLFEFYFNPEPWLCFAFFQIILNLPEHFLPTLRSLIWYDCLLYQFIQTTKIAQDAQNLPSFDFIEKFVEKEVVQSEFSLTSDLLSSLQTQVPEFYSKFIKKK